MANASGTLAGAAVVQRALEIVFTERPMLKQITVNTADLGGGNTALLNQVVNTRILSIPAAVNFPGAATDTAYTDVPVTINQAKQFSFAFPAAEYNATNRDLVEEAARPCAIGLANHLIDAVAAVWIAANFANSTIVASGWTYTNTVLPLRNALAGRGVPQDWFLAANSAVYGALLADSMMVAALNSPENADAVASGKLKRASGMAPVEYPAIPATGNMVAFAGGKDSVVLATRIPTHPESLMPGVKYPGEWQVITEPTTGLSVVLNQYIDAATAVINYRLILMYGVAKGNGANGQILKTA